MIRVSSDFKVLVTTAFDAALFFDSSDHVLTDMIALLCKMSMQTINIIALFSLAMSPLQAVHTDCDESADH